MVREVSPLLTEALSDVVRARPRQPVDFLIAWLASRKDAAAADAEQRAPPAKSVSKLRDAVAFDAAVEAGGAPVETVLPSTPAVAAPDDAPAFLEEKRIFVLGDLSSGKTTLLKAMQGDAEPSVPICRRPESRPH